MSEIEVPYNHDLKPLEALLSTTTRTGDFYVSNTLEIPMPRLEVDGLGPLSFPIPSSQAKALIALASRAPYGRGEDTIVDTAVRNVWQISPDSINLYGKSWPATFDRLLTQVQEGLGIPNIDFLAEPYKLLVYEPGGFFLPHRDTEKAPGMFGTLVLTLPSQYSGGALRIAHAGREVIVETKVSEPSEISFTAFYADCEHEALPVTSGHRVCLVYNLIQEKPKSKKPLQAPNCASPAAQAATLLDTYWKSESAPPKIAWLLEHQYSPEGLAFANLKGADAARAEVLLQAAQQADLSAHLAIVHIGESGAAEYDYRPSRRRYYSYNEDDEDEPEEQDDEGFAVAEVFESWRQLDQWRDTGDQPVAFGPIDLGDDELLPQGALDGEAPDEKRFYEATGNEGASFERAYHRAALVLWPTRNTIDVLLQAGPTAALPFLTQLAAQGPGTPQSLRAARRVIEAWPEPLTAKHLYLDNSNQPKATDRAALIDALVNLNAPELLERFLRINLIPTYEGPENDAILRAAPLFGPAKTTALFQHLVAHHITHRHDQLADLLFKLALAGTAILDDIALSTVAMLDEIQPARIEYGPYREYTAPKPVFLVDLFSALSLCKKELLAESAAERIAALPDAFPILTLVVPALSIICANTHRLPPSILRAMEILWTGAAQYLLAQSETKPQAPKDWSQLAKLNCNCADCATLQTFARDPIANIHRFRVNKERRRHLHNQITHHGLDMTHETERQGSPQTLVCIKTRRTFQNRMHLYKEEIQAMRELLKFDPKATQRLSLSQRLEAAIKISNN